MDDMDNWDKFFDYLDKSNLGKPTSQMGLIADAPLEAIEAYEKYKRVEAESDPNDE
jgi:hypothetical protein